MKSNELYQQITNQILDLMEAHGSDWCRPWVGQGGGAHRNIVTGAHYRGINVLLLGLAGYDLPLWGTYRQWKAKGGTVRRGEHGTLGLYYKSLTVGDDDQERTIPMMRHFFLFNVDQVDGVEIEKPEPRPEPERIVAVEQFVHLTGADIRTGGDRACYIPSRDQIRIPELSAFGETEPYYSTLLHELSHWTGHKSRLDRADGMRSRFGDEAYAMEELVSELSSAFLSISLEVAHEPRVDHAKYLNNWLAVLKGDMKAFTSAASKAQAAADYLVGLQTTAEEAAA